MSESSRQSGSTETGAARASPGRGLADMVAAPRAGTFAASFPRLTLAKVAVLAALLVLLNFRHIAWLVKYWRDPDWAHGYVIPLFSIYLLWSRRQDLFAAPRRTCLWGLAAMLLCLAGEVLGFYPIRNYWFSQICMIGVLFGLTWYLGGTAAIRVAWLPILFLVFAIPISPRLYTRISLPLQNLSARGAEVILRIFQVNVTHTASVMDLVSRSGQLRQLTVAEACSGMRLLMAFLALGVAMAYLDYKPLWQRIVLVVAAIPIAVFCNILRVAITSWMYYLDKPELGQDFMHTFTGLLMLIPAFGLLWLLAWILRHTLVEEPEEAAP